MQTRRRAQLVAAIGLPCPYCGELMQTPSRDHIKPRSRGHSLNGNCVIVCEQCNTDKGSKSLYQFLIRLVDRDDPRVPHVAAFIYRRQ